MREVRRSCAAIALGAITSILTAAVVFFLINLLCPGVLDGGDGARGSSGWLFVIVWLLSIVIGFVEARRSYRRAACRNDSE